MYESSCQLQATRIMKCEAKLPSTSDCLLQDPVNFLVSKEHIGINVKLNEPLDSDKLDSVSLLMFLFMALLMAPLES